MSKFDSYLELGIEAKREGRYNEALRFYDAAYKLAKTNSISMQSLCEFFKAYGKLNFIIGDYTESCDAYIYCIKASKQLAKKNGITIRNFRDLYNADWNIIYHFGYSVLALNNIIDSVTIDTYRRGIDPYYDKTVKKIDGKPMNDVNNMAIDAVGHYVIKNMPEIFS